MQNLGYLVATLIFIGMLLVKEKKIEEDNKEDKKWEGKKRIKGSRQNLLIRTRKPGITSSQDQEEEKA